MRRGARPAPHAEHRLRAARARPPRAGREADRGPLAEADALSRPRGRAAACSPSATSSSTTRRCRRCSRRAARRASSRCSAWASFSPRSLDVDVVLDLMIHDLQILHALDPSAGRRGAGDRHRGAVAAHRHRQRAARARGGLRRQPDRLAGLRRAGAQAAGLPADALLSLDYQAQEIKGYRLEGRRRGAADRRRGDLPVETRRAAAPGARGLPARLPGRARRRSFDGEAGPAGAGDGAGGGARRSAAASDDAGPAAATDPI